MNFHVTFNIRKSLTNLCAFRKRSREEEPGDKEFFPLSKRINQLKIHAEFTQFPNPLHQQQQQQQSVPDKPIESYAPELSPEENPHYYLRNKELYDLFQQRKHREKMGSLWNVLECSFVFMFDWSVFRDFLPINLFLYLVECLEVKIFNNLKDNLITGISSNCHCLEEFQILRKH